MADETANLERVGAQVAADLGRGPGADRRRSQRRALIARVGTGDVRRGWWRWLGLAAAVGIAVAVAALILPGERPLDFSVGNEPGLERQGRWIRNSDQEALPVRFADGSVIELGADTEARVVEANTDAVRVDLSVGEVVARIRPEDDIRWTIEAGPYRITVLGTVFSVAWSPVSSDLVVRVDQGVVLVEGRGLAPRGIELAAGDRLEIQGCTGRYAVAPVSGAIGMADAVASSTIEPTRESKDPVGARSSEPRTSTGERARPVVSVSPSTPAIEEAEVPPGALDPGPLSWAEHYEREDYRAAIDAALESGLDDLLAGGTQQELRQLGDAARYAGRGAVATKVLETIRERFAESAHARTAAFLLGRVSQELRGDPATARRWFETYLDEAPAGPLSEEALGRLVDASERAGDRAAARRAAEQYLERYPEGVFARLARSVLDE